MDIYIGICCHFNIYSVYTYIKCYSKSTTSVCLLHMESRNGKFMFVFCRRQMEFCFPWSAKITMLAVSANVPIYVIMYNMEVHMHKYGHLQF